MPVRRHPIAAGQSPQRLDVLPVDLALVGRLQATYQRARARDLQLAELFYGKLFAAAPHLRPLFRGDMPSQARKLIAALDMVVQNFKNPHANLVALTEMGRRHAGYGAKPEHYGLVVELLVQSMGELLGDLATPKELQDWHLALTLISRIMIEGAATATPEPAANTAAH